MLLSFAFNKFNSFGNRSKKIYKSSNIGTNPYKAGINSA